MPAVVESVSESAEVDEWFGATDGESAEVDAIWYWEHRQEAEAAAASDSVFDVTSMGSPSDVSPDALYKPPARLLVDAIVFAAAGTVLLLSNGGLVQSIGLISVFAAVASLMQYAKVASSQPNASRVSRMLNFVRECLSNETK